MLYFGQTSIWGRIYDIIVKKTNYFPFFLVITINFVFLQNNLPN